MTKAIKVTYNSFAVPQFPYNVELGVIYNCVKENDKYFIQGNGFNREFSLEFIKQMFKPCKEYNWEMLNDKIEIEEIENTSVSKRKYKKKEDK